MATPARAFELRGPSGFLLTNGAGRTSGEYRRGIIIYSQGDVANSIYLVQQGRVLLNVVSCGGKEAVVGIAGPGDYFGEDCILDEERRACSAIVLERSLLVRIEKQEMKYALCHSPGFCESFLHQVLRRKKQVEESLADQLFSSSERRLARILLLLARDSEGGPASTIPRLSQTTLAAMVGTTRSRISYFLGKFRKLGLIEYGQRIRVNAVTMGAMLKE